MVEWYPSMTGPDEVLVIKQRRRWVIAAGIGALINAGVVWLVGAWLAAISSVSAAINPWAPVLAGVSMLLASILAWWLGRSYRILGFENGSLLRKRFRRVCRIKVDDRVRVMRWTFCGVPIYSIKSAGRFCGRWAVGFGYRSGQLDALFVVRRAEVEDRNRYEGQGS